MNQIAFINGVSFRFELVDNRLDITCIPKLLQPVQGNNCMVLFHERNRGKGRAIRTALEHVTGDVVVIQDADLEYNPQEFLKMVKLINAGSSDVVYGSRNLDTNPPSGLTFYWGGKFLTWLTNVLYGGHLTDESTCYKMFRTSVIKSLNLRCERFEFCPEVTAKVLRRGFRIVEVPIKYSPRRKAEGKKIRWLDGLQAMWVLLRYRFFD